MHHHGLWLRQKLTNFVITVVMYLPVSATCTTVGKGADTDGFTLTHWNLWRTLLIDGKWIIYRHICLYAPPQLCGSTIGFSRTENQKCPPTYTVCSKQIFVIKHLEQLVPDHSMNANESFSSCIEKGMWHVLLTLSASCAGDLTLMGWR
jgi:hypothetical protein